MDPEPERCRRIDDKKWRCGKNVFPDQNYCERHMHRDRLRSRKLVEADKNISQFNRPTTTCSNKTKQTIKSHDPADANTKFPAPGSHQFKMPSFKRSNGFPVTVASTTTSSANGKSRGNSNVFVNSVTSKPGAIDNSNSNNYSTDITTTTVTNTFHNADTYNAISRNNSKYVDGKNPGFSHINDKKNNNRNSKNGNNQNGFVTPGFVFTLKSVCHDDMSSSKSSCDHRCVAEVEQQRCRRTDGKKWRCSRDVVPQQKYCDSHMHRGAKRLMVSSKAVTVAAASPPVAIPKNDHINLNITVDSPQPTSDDVNNSTSSSSSSSSDATTVTDENTSVSHLLALSP